MRTSEFYNRVTAGGGDVVEELLELFGRNGIRYCVIGGQAVNCYAEPLVSLDLVVATDQLEAVEALLSDRFVVRRFPHSLNVYPGESDLRIRLQTDSRYADFVDRAERGSVLGIEMSVASARDVMRGKCGPRKTRRVGPVSDRRTCWTSSGSSRRIRRCGSLCPRRYSNGSSPNRHNLSGCRGW